MVFFNRFRRSNIKDCWIRIELANGGYVKVYGKNLTRMIKQLLQFFMSLRGQIELHSTFNEPMALDLILSLLEENNIDLSNLR
jgi:hypothetical protein